VAEKNRTKALAPTAVFWSPNRRTGGEQLPVVMRCTGVHHLLSNSPNRFL